MTYAVLLAVTVVSSATLVVLGSLAIFFGAIHTRPMPASSAAMPENDAVLIFRDETLIDCSDKARLLLDSLDPDPEAARGNDPLGRLLRYLSKPFPDIVTELSRLAETGEIALEAADGSGMRLDARFQNGLTRLQLTDTQAEGSLVALDRLSFEALTAEVETLRKVARHVPVLIWQTDERGKVVWANAPYIAKLRETMPELTLTWPLPDLFETGPLDGSGRVQIAAEGQTHWFAYAQTALDQRRMHFATPIDSAIQSEAARRETLQTLTRTFASLKIGLALFDADRRLQVFNPALVDMTGLEPLFLAARPSFEQLLYALREARMLPEPKDFNNWRREIIEMEKAAETGEYSEEWCLEGGRTFRVTGRPQPDGAIGLFIEDVTTEAALSRSFRAEIETVHKVLDGLADGIITFSLAGQALLANDAYTTLWKTDPCTDLADGGLVQAIALWSEQCEPSTFWARLAEFAGYGLSGEGEQKLSATIVRRDGVMMSVTARRLRGGNLMLVFQQMGLGAPVLAQRSEQELQSALIRRPDLALDPAPVPVPVPRTAAPVAQEVPARKGRSARHAGNRLRI